MNPKKLLWTERYRPTKLEELITPNRISEKLSKGLYQNFLFYGSPGTGKCVTGDTKITIKDKETGEIKEITISEFHKLI